VRALSIAYGKSDREWTTAAISAVESEIIIFELGSIEGNLLAAMYVRFRLEGNAVAIATVAAKKLLSLHLPNSKVVDYERY
jgi:hypothetical protein